MTINEKNETYNGRLFDQPKVDALVHKIRKAPDKHILDVKLIQTRGFYYIRVNYTEEKKKEEVQ